MESHQNRRARLKQAGVTAGGPEWSVVRKVFQGLYPFVGLTAGSLPTLEKKRTRIVAGCANCRRPLQRLKERHLDYDFVPRLQRAGVPYRGF